MSPALSSATKSLCLASVTAAICTYISWECWSQLTPQLISANILLTEFSTVGDSPLLLLPLLLVTVSIAFYALWISLSHLLVSLCLTLVHSGLQLNLRKVAQWKLLAPQARRLLTRTIASSAILSTVVLSAAQASPQDSTFEDLRWGSTASSSQPVQIPPPADTSVVPAIELVQPSTSLHVVQSGESLWSIAASTLQTADVEAISDFWPEIWQLNRHIIGEDPNLILPGQELSLPQLPQKQ